MLSAPDDDPSVSPEPRRVEELFERVSPLIELHIAGRCLKTTVEHPFYVEGKGWLKAGALSSGDLLHSHDGCLMAVESVVPTREVATVYNLRIAEYHTYYVGCEDWGFSVWSHNLSCAEHAAVLRQNLINADFTPSAGDAAAHLVPSGSWTLRNFWTGGRIARLQNIVNEAGIGTDHAANGFFTSSSNQLGTHRNTFFTYLEKELSRAGGDRKAIIDTLKTVSQDLLTGKISF